MRLEITRKHGIFMEKFAVAKDNYERLSLLDEYMKDHADDVQSFLHHIEQGSVYCAREPHAI